MRIFSRRRSRYKVASVVIAVYPITQNKQNKAKQDKTTHRTECATRRRRTKQQKP